MNKENQITKTTGQIFKDNICTLFNLFNLLIAIALACVGAWSNMFFILIIAVNVCIGIVQELKAKKLVEELSLLSMPTADIIRNNEKMHVSVQEVEDNDILLLESGNQICADSVILSGELEVNESLLTGESDPIIKKQGDSLLSGSSVISGKCQAKVLHTGSENYVSKIADEVKKLKKVNSELLLSMRKVTGFTGWLIIPLGVILFLEAYFLRSNSLQTAVVSTAAGLLGMLPKGLVLLISIGLATGIVRLSKQKVLVQDLYSIESLAHVDIICLDKTGTITEGKMQVENVIMLDNDFEIPFNTVMGVFLGNTDDNNATFQAMKNYFPQADEFQVISKIPFSSDRKWSAVTFDNGNTFVIGAPERLCDKELPEAVRHEMKEGKRILLAGVVDKIEDKTINASEVHLLAAIIISDPIRKNAVSAISYFHKEEVDVKVISGDNPVTVSAVAAKAGIKGADRFIDMSTVSDEDIPKVAKAYSVFGRVTPQQKKYLISAMQNEGHNVAMTGDGVNDLLAMKQADCSIAMGNGSDAARQTAQLVLLDSDFSVLKSVLAEGRRVVNNITKSAGVFFIKTIYSVLLCIICILLNMDFPFIPIQITLIDLIIEGYPSFFISFEPNDKKIKGKFLPTALKNAAPNAIAITLCCLIIGGASFMVPNDSEQTALLMYLTVGMLGIVGVIKSCRPFNKLRAFLAITTTIGFFTAVLLFHKILKLPLISMNTLLLFVGITVIGIIIERICAALIAKVYKH